MSNPLVIETRKLAPSAPIELYELDLTPKLEGSNNKQYFHAGTNELQSAIIWKGISYQPWGISVTGFAVNTQGTLPKLKVQISNKGGMITLLAANYDDLFDVKLTRRKTFARFLDAANFAEGNPEADPTQELPSDVFYFWRKVSENRVMVELEFASELDVSGRKLPGRCAYANVCSWLYRSSECSYSGLPVANYAGTLLSASGVTPEAITAPFPYWDSQTAYTAGKVVALDDQRRVFCCLVPCTGKSPDTNPTYWFADDCGGQLSDCAKRTWPDNILPYGAFPSLVRVPTVK